MKKEDPFTVYNPDATRSFCYIDDAVDALKLIINSKTTNKETINIGRSDGEIKISKLVEIIFSIANTSPKLIFKNGPKGSVQRRCPNIDKLINLGFCPNTDMKKGIEQTYNWYVKEEDH